jgi:hypothetical protein
MSATGACLVRVLLVSGASLGLRLFGFAACACWLTMRLARVWRAYGPRLARVCCVCMVCVWRASGAFLARVWCVFGCLCVVCLARVWRLSGACMERGACAGGAWNVHGASRV